MNSLSSLSSNDLRISDIDELIEAFDSSSLGSSRKSSITTSSQLLKDVKESFARLAKSHIQDAYLTKQFINQLLELCQTHIDIVTGEELLILITTTILAIDQTDYENTLEQVIHGLCTLSYAFLTKSHRTHYLSLYGTVPWLEELINKPQEAKSLCIDLLDHVIEQRSLSGLNTIVHSPTETPPSHHPYHLQPTSSLQDWYAVCYWINQLLPKNIPFTLSKAISDWANANRAHSEEVMRGIMGLTVLQLAKPHFSSCTLDSYNTHSCYKIPSCAELLWQTLPHLQSRKCQSDLAKCFCDPDPSEATLLLFALEKPTNSLEWVSTLDDKILPMIFTLLENNALTSDEIESYFIACLYNKEMTTSGRFALFAKTLNFLKNHFMTGLDLVEDCFTAVYNLYIEKNELVQAQEAFLQVLSTNWRVWDLQQLYTGEPVNSNYGLSEMPLLSRCNSFIDYILEIATALNFDSRTMRDRLYEQLIKALIDEIETLHDEHPDSKDVDRLYDIALKNAMVCVLCELYFKVSSKKIAFADIVKLTQKEYSLSTKPQNFEPRHLTRSRFVNARLLAEATAVKIGDTLFIGFTHDIQALTN